MISLFKRKTETATIEVVEEPISRYPKEVEEIHHAFETASDRLLEEAKSVIDQSSSFNLDKVKRLSALGFKNVKEVESGQKIIQKVELSKEQVELIKYYNKEYPKNKFITEAQVMEICHKYNLVCGNVDRFKGFVPEKNLIDIENFKVKGQDLSWFYNYGGNTPNTVENLMKRWGHPYDYFVNSRNIENRKCFQQTNITLKICAPIKDMDISGLTLKDGYRLEKHIPDPVVLQPVKGGYLVVTAWGDEANDPILK
jgi:hypothetical protein